MIMVMGHIKLASDKIDRLTDAMAAQLSATRAEDGCDRYGFARDVLDPGLIIISERWRDQRALDAHCPLQGTTYGRIQRGLGKRSRRSHQHKGV